MDLSTFVQSAAVMIVAAASLRAMASVFAFAVGRYQSIQLERKQINRFREIAVRRYREGGLEPHAQTGSAQWSGLRKFRVTARVFETPDKSIASYHLVPVDGQPLANFRPGQFLTLQLPLTGLREPLLRTYSISSSPSEHSYYRISVKRIVPPVGAPPGRASSYLHARIGEGDVLDLKAPAGGFFLDQKSSRPVVLVAGGVGLTPLVSMLDWLVATNSKREVWLFHGVRNGAEHPMRNHLAAICRSRPNVRMVVAYSRPTRSCVRGVDYHVPGHVTADLLAPLVKARDCEIYLCGPAAMMASLRRGLVGLGVEPVKIKQEAFGPGLRQEDAAALQQKGSHEIKTFRVRYALSGKTAAWTQEHGSLLELAEAHGVKARCACRQGMCGTCTVAVTSGAVGYLRHPANDPDPGSCLPCIAKPESDLVLQM